MSHTARSFGTLFCGLAFVFGAVASAEAAIPAKAIIRTGALLPDTPAGTHFREVYGHPVFDAEGGVTFLAGIDVPGVFDTTAALVYRDGHLHSIAYEKGASLPGLPNGYHISSIPVYALESRQFGSALLRTTNESPTDPAIQGTWALSGSVGPRLLAGTGAVPGSSTLSWPGSPIGIGRDRLGNTTFLTSVAVAGSATAEQGIWAGTSADNLHLVARTNAPVGGLSPLLWGSFKCVPAPMPDGTAAFVATYTSAPTTGALFVAGGPNLKTIATSGDVVPGTSLRFGAIYQQTPQVNPRGDMAFKDVKTLWRRTAAGVFTPIASTQAMAGVPMFGALPGLNPITDSGDVLLTAADGALARGIWRIPADTQRADLIAKVGLPAVAFGSGATFAQIYDPSTSVDGYLAFNADVRLASGVIVQDALFAATPTNQVVRLFGADMPVDIGNGQTAVVSRATVYGRDFSDIVNMQFGLNGQLAVTATMTDGTQAVVLVNVPEPVVVSLIAVVGAISLRRNRRH